MRLITTFVALMLTAFAATAQQPLATNKFYPERVQVLDQLLAEQRFDALISELVPEKFKPSMANVVVNHNLTTDISWLQSKAEQGYIPLLYVLAYRMLPKDPDGAMKLYARARTWAFLDAKECRSDPRYPWSNILERSFPDLHQERTRNPMVYLQSVDEALRIDAERTPVDSGLGRDTVNEALHIDAERTTRPSSAWYCEAAIKGNMLPPEQAAVARREKAKEMKEYNQRKLLSGKDD